MTKFNVGDAVRVLNKREIMGGSHLEDGKTYRVERMMYGYPVIRGRVIVSSEFHAIEHVRESDTNRRLTEAEAKIAALEAEVKALKDASKPTHITVNADSQTFDNYVTARKIADALGVSREPKTPNQRRADVIKRAQAFLVNYDCRGNLTKREGFRAPVSYRPICDAEFIVNVDKRTVVCLLRDQVHEGIHAKAVAKCAPDDVFNAGIGKAIALGRALGLEPAEFTHEAVQPTERVYGMMLRCTDGTIRKVVQKFSGGSDTTELNSYNAKNGTIIDDTDAVYL